MLVQLMEAKVSYVKINEIGESNELLNLTMWI